MRSVPEQVAGPQHRTHREGVALKHSRVYTHLNSMRKAGVKCTTLIAKMLRFRLLRPPSENAEYPACFEALTRPKPGDRRLYSNLSFINQVKILLRGVERLPCAGLRTHRIDPALPSCTNLLIDAPAVWTAHRSVADLGVVRSLAAGLWGWELPSKKSPFFALTVYPVSGTLTTLFH
jgi:hypothetical protein